MKIILYILVCSSLTFCQNNNNLNTEIKEPLFEKTKYSGPRFGFINYSKDFGEILDYVWDTPSTIMQVGWETKLIIAPIDNGFKGFTKLIWLFAGFEEGIFLPQLNWQMGLITKNNIELGIGPHMSFIGPALCFSAENTFSAIGMRYPISLNIAVQKNEYFVSFLIGFETPN